jgi:ABC-type dipeptide/oligopeptide/nickel transport system permease component
MGKMIGGSFSATKDIFTVMGYATLVAFSGIFSKLISDIVCAVFDPRVALHK